jgi:DNA invertase Pin-like site-specific DNA recombinase
MIANYVRISDKSQKFEKQLKQVDKQYIDVISGKTPFIERPKAKELIRDIAAKQITQVTIHEVSRLGRDLQDCINTLSFMHENGVTIYVHNIGMYSVIDGKENPAFKMVVTILANIAERELETLRERQADGIRLALLVDGKYKGRLKGSRMSSTERCDKNKDIVRYFNKNKRNPVTKYSYRDIAKLTGKNLSTVQRVAKAYEELGTRAVYAGDPFGASASPVLKR